MEQSKRIAKNTGILYARMGIGIFLSLYTTRVTLQALGVNDFGIFNLVGGVIAMLGFLNASMAAATQRFMSFTQGEGNFSKVKQIFNVSLLLHIVVAVALLIIFEVAGYFLFHGVLNIPANRQFAAQIVYQFMIISTLFTVISVPFDAVINTHENMLLFAVLGILESVLKMLLAIYLISATGDKLIVYGFITGAITLFLLLLRLWYCSKKYSECQISLRRNYDNALFHELKNFAGWTFLGSSTSMIAYYGQGIVINIFFGTAVNAAQGLANQISGQLGVFAATMLRALNPLIDKSEGAGNRSLMLQTSMIGSKISFFLLMLFIVPVLIEMPFILNLWLKDVPPYAIIFCELLLIKNLIEQLCIPIVSSIAAVGNIKKFQVSGAIISCFPLAITYVLYYLGYPPQTLYIIFTTYAIVHSANTLYFANKTCGLSYSVFFSEVVLKCFICVSITSVLAAIPMLILEPGIVRFLLVCLVNFISFLISIWYFGLSKSERGGMQKLIINFTQLSIPKAKRLLYRN